MRSKRSATVGLEGEDVRVESERGDKLERCVYVCRTGWGLPFWLENQSLKWVSLRTYSVRAAWTADGRCCYWVSTAVSRALQKNSDEIWLLHPTSLYTSLFLLLTSRRPSIISSVLVINLSSLVLNTWSSCYFPRSQKSTSTPTKKDKDLVFGALPIVPILISPAASIPSFKKLS
ncbi:hypothetical protein H4582DRAFT_345432 [Lactarius indigo]|nr:hypothetical protein H4582DRAFT_345432 [Lactarius indigo]